MMRHWQFVAVLVTCLIGSAIGTRGVAALLSPSSHAAAQSGADPAVDLSPSTKIAAMTGGANPATDALIRSAQAAVRLHPDSASYYTNLALAYIQKERE